MSTEIIQSIIEYFGSQDATAKALKVRQAAVSQWLTGKTTISTDSAIRIEKATNGKFKAVELSPRLAKIHTEEL